MIKFIKWLFKFVDKERLDAKDLGTDNQSLLKVVSENLSISHVEKIYATITEMIRFAEAKNGVLLTVNIAMFIEFAKYGFEKSASLLTNVCNIATWITLLSSIAILFISFLPRLKATNSFNPIYFGSIISSRKEEYTNHMKNASLEELHDYYCEQIHINSDIANRKFIQFRYALILSIIALIGFGIFKIMSDETLLVDLTRYHIYISR